MWRVRPYTLALSRVRKEQTAGKPSQGLTVNGLGWQEPGRGFEWPVLYAGSSLSQLGERSGARERKSGLLFHLSRTRCPNVRLDITVLVMFKRLSVVRAQRVQCVSWAGGYISALREQINLLLEWLGVYVKRRATLPASVSCYVSELLWKHPVWKFVLRWDGPWVFTRYGGKSK